MNTDILPDGHTFAGLRRNRYQAMLVDVPWKYLTWSKKGRGRSADRHYPTMTIDEIKALPVRDLVAKNCVMFFWVIDSHVLLAHEIIEAWGFKYKTVGLYWAKTNKDGSFFMGSGFWTRANPEHAFECYLGEESEVERCFLNTVGKPKRTNKDVRRLIVSRRRDHSQKPDETHERIERLVDGPYLELFARRWRDGWSCWGDELNKPGRDPEMETLI
jgi:N6-adenosine-specific RNA methylase IME4